MLLKQFSPVLSDALGEPFGLPPYHSIPVGVLPPIAMSATASLTCNFLLQVVRQLYKLASFRRSTIIVLRHARPNGPSRAQASNRSLLSSCNWWLLNFARSLSRCPSAPELTMGIDQNPPVVRFSCGKSLVKSALDERLWFQKGNSVISFLLMIKIS